MGHFVSHFSVEFKAMCPLWVWIKYALIFLYVVQIECEISVLNSNNYLIARFLQIEDI